MEKRQSRRAWGSAFTGVRDGGPESSRAPSLLVNLNIRGEIEGTGASDPNGQGLKSIKSSKTKGLRGEGSGLFN